MTDYKKGGKNMETNPKIYFNTLQSGYLGDEEESDIAPPEVEALLPTGMDDKSNSIGEDELQQLQDDADDNNILLIQSELNHTVTRKGQDEDDEDETIEPLYPAGMIIN